MHAPVISSSIVSLRFLVRGPVSSTLPSTDAFRTPRRVVAFWKARSSSGQLHQTALTAAKVKGKRLGQRIAEAKHRATAARAEAIWPVITETAHLSMNAAADELSCRGITSASGKPWHVMQLRRVGHRLGV